MLLKGMTSQMGSWMKQSITCTTLSTPCSMEPVLCLILPPTIPSFWSEFSPVFLTEILHVVYYFPVFLIHTTMMSSRCSTLSPTPFSTSGWRGLFRPTPPSRMRWPPSVTTGITTWFPSSLQSLMKRFMSHLSNWDIPTPFPWMVSKNWNHFVKRLWVK